MMKNSWGIKVLIFVVLAFIFFYTFNSGNSVPKPSSLDYSSRLKNERIEKNRYFKENVESPIENKSKFEGLIYYEIDEKYKVIAQLQIDNSRKVFVVKTTDNNADTMLVYGKVSFNLNGENNSLTIFKTQQNRLLFLPFKDKTSGNGTYGGGRFLDIPITDIAGDKVVIDFNLAYHPYCAYNYTYICPVPPAENTLKIEILAGEKL